MPAKGDWVKLPNWKKWHPVVEVERNPMEMIVILEGTYDNYRYRSMGIWLFRDEEEEIQESLVI